MEFDNLLKLIKTVSDSSLTGFKYEEDGVKISMRSGGEIKVISAGETVNIPAAAPAVTASAEAAAEGPKLTGNVVVSPLVGTFYAAPSEDAKPFVTVGDTVKKGQTLAIVEAMKLMNEIESDFDGVVEEILAANGKPVEYGQPLFRIG